MGTLPYSESVSGRSSITRKSTGPLYICRGEFRDDSACLLVDFQATPFTRSWGEPIPLAEKSALTSADEFVVTTAFVEHEVTAGSSVTYTLRAVLR